MRLSFSPQDLFSFNVGILLPALSLSVSILEQQAKYDAALEVLSGDLGSLMGREEDKLRLQLISRFIYLTVSCLVLITTHLES